MVPMPQAHMHSPIKSQKLGSKDHFDWQVELIRWKKNSGVRLADSACVVVSSLFWEKELLC